MNISNGIVWIVFDNHDKLVGCFTKEEFAKAACSGHTGWYYQGRHTVKQRGPALPLIGVMKQAV